MKAEIITIGDELLIGQTIDTNSAWIGAEMSRLDLISTGKYRFMTKGTISLMH